MNLRDLEYLTAVAEQLHFGRAAEACHVSQPTLSMQLKKLEDYLGVKLFERSNKHVMLTATGTAILEQARQALNAAHAIKQIARHASDPLSGTMHLGVFPTLGPYLLPHLLPLVRQGLPKIDLLLSEEKTGTLLNQLRDGKLDCALLALPLAESGLVHTALFDEPFLLAVPKHHPLAKRSHIHAEDILSEPVLLLEEGHCLREQALAFCQRIGIGEANNFRATSLETLRHMVAAGNAITLMPKLATRVKDPWIRYIPFAAPEPSRRIGLVWRASAARQSLFVAFTHLFKHLKP